MTTETEVTVNVRALTIALKKRVVPENRWWNNGDVKWTFPFAYIKSGGTAVFLTDFFTLPYT